MSRPAARRWLLIGLAIGACSSSGGGDGAKVKPEPKPSESAKPPAVVPPPAPARSADDGYDTGALGAIAFQLSEGTPVARALFARGLLALHSFWYDEAARQFEAAIAVDRGMNMAYWGAAMSRLKLLWGDD